MTRINVPLEDGRIGWFNDATAERFEEGTEWDGNNHVGLLSRIPSNFGGEALYRTPQGRWIRNNDARRYFNGHDVYEFISDEAARDWLLRAERDEVVERFFGDLEEEKGPGRPEVGPATNIRLGPELTAKVDALRHEGQSRAEVIRRLLEQALA